MAPAVLGATGACVGAFAGAFAEGAGAFAEGAGAFAEGAAFAEVAGVVSGGGGGTSILPPPAFSFKSHPFSLALVCKLTCDIGAHCMSTWRRNSRISRKQ